MTTELTNKDMEKNIFGAIDKNEFDLLKTYFVFQQNVDILDENLMTPLQHACYKGNKEIVQFLLDQVSSNSIKID